jgi:hypothetical protein
MDMERLRRIINENQDAFNALEESDRTGKLRKLSYKQKMNFTIDEEILLKFRNYCQVNNMKMSTKIESLIKEFLKKQAQKV